MRPGIAVHHSHDTRLARFGQHRARIIFRVTSVNDHRAIRLTRHHELLGESPALLDARRVVVVVVEPALAYRYRARLDVLSQVRDVAHRIESARVVGMNSGGVPDESGIPRREDPRRASGAEDIPGAAAGADADDRFGSAFARALDYVAAVAVERLVGEVRVAVDEPFDIPVFLGHFLSIHSSVGPAT